MNKQNQILCSNCGQVTTIQYRDCKLFNIYDASQGLLYACVCGELCHQENIEQTALYPSLEFQAKRNKKMLEDKEKIKQLVRVKYEYQLQKDLREESTQKEIYDPCSPSY
jgi:hypothetical protein